MHGKRRRSPARFSVAFTNPYKKLSNNQPGKPIGEDQTNYDPEALQQRQEMELNAARLKAGKWNYDSEVHDSSSSAKKGSGAHTHSEGGNVFKQQSDLYKSPELRLTSSQAEGTGIQSSFQQKMQSMFGKQMQLQTASPLAKKGGFKMKRKK